MLNIIGIGTDIVNITRIEKAIDRFGDKFIKKIYTKNEIALSNKFTCNKKIYSFYAKRFAAKEALVKALGVGFTKDISFTDIEILNNKEGKPIINLYNNLQIRLSNAVIHLSLSDDYPFAVANLIILT